MKTRHVAPLALLLACAHARSVPSPPAPAPPPSPLAGLAWLAGTWRGDDRGVATEEHWTTPEGGALLGLHKDVKDGRMIAFEHLRIEATPDGAVYHASPQGRPPTPFRLVEQGPRRVVFANPRHDFPTRILYWLDDAGALHARIEGTRAGKPAAREWVWKKAATYRERERAGLPQ